MIIRCLNVGAFLSVCLLLLVFFCLFVLIEYFFSKRFPCFSFIAKSPELNAKEGNRDRG
jgi:hypothetical protein